jgi:AcrR family transcriptional regulator
LARKKSKPSTQRFSVRKAPTQERAAATVDAILRATARIVSEVGYDAATTNHIAKKAGVSVGSLYQYFPNKAAILRTLIERHLEKMEKILTPDPALLGQPFPVLAGALVKAFLEVHATDPKLLEQMLAHSEKVGVPQRQFVIQRGEQLVQAVLQLYANQMRPLDRELATFTIVAAVEGIAVRATKDRPELLTDPKLVAETVELLVRYVEAAKPKAGALRA